jgi:hypothetical protein
MFPVQEQASTFTEGRAAPGCLAEVDRACAHNVSGRIAGILLKQLTVVISSTSEDGDIATAVVKNHIVERPHQQALNELLIRALPFRNRQREPGFALTVEADDAFGATLLPSHRAGTDQLISCVRANTSRVAKSHLILERSENGKLSTVDQVHDVVCMNYSIQTCLGGVSTTPESEPGQFLSLIPSSTTHPHRHTAASCAVH